MNTTTIVIPRHLVPLPSQYINVPLFGLPTFLSSLSTSSIYNTKSATNTPIHFSFFLSTFPSTSKVGNQYSHIPLFSLFHCPCIYEIVSSFCMIAMARAALFLFALAILLPLAILSEAVGVYRLINVETEGWAKNFPPGGSRPPFSTGVIVDDNFASIYERWAVEHYEEGFRIRNVGTGFWLTARHGEAVGYSEFDEEASKWYIEGAGGDSLSIKRPNEDVVMTADHNKQTGQVLIALQPADGADAQKWRLERTDTYRRASLYVQE